MASRKTGRKTEVSRENLLGVLSNYKNKIIVNEQGEVLSKKDELWITISTELGKKLQASSLYSIVCGNQRDRIKEALYRMKYGKALPQSFEGEASTSTVQPAGNQQVDNTEANAELPTDFSFIFKVNKDKLKEYTCVTTKITKIATGKTKKTEIREFNNNTLYKSFFSNALNDGYMKHGIYEKTRRICALNFSNEYIRSDLTHMTINGKNKMLRINNY